MSVGNAFFSAIIDVVYAILNFYWYAVIIGAVLSWLVAFDVINPYNRIVRVVGDFLTRITEPLLAPIRRRLPPVGTMDLSPLVLMLIIYFIQRMILRLVF